MRSKTKLRGDKIRDWIFKGADLEERQERRRIVMWSALALLDDEQFKKVLEIVKLSFSEV